MESLRVDRLAADEFVNFWTREAAKRWGETNREAWLWAFDRYDFTVLDPAMLNRLKGIADSFREWRKNGGR